MMGQHKMITSDNPSSSTHTPVEQALLLAQQELYKSVHDDPDRNKDKTNATKDDLSQEGLLMDTNGDDHAEEELPPDCYYHQHRQLQQQYYHYKNRTRNELPYKDWTQFFPDLDLIQGNYCHSKSNTGRDTNTSKTNVDEVEDKDMDTIKEDTGEEEHCSTGAAFGTNEHGHDLDKIIKYRNLLKESIMDKLLAEIKNDMESDSTNNIM